MSACLSLRSSLALIPIMGLLCLLPASGDAASRHEVKTPAVAGEAAPPAAHAAPGGHGAAGVDPAEALARLKKGNWRFSSAPFSNGKPVADRRAETGQAQHPYAVVVGCADSRTPPELIFDTNLGELFVVRAAGNLLDAYGLGSVEYAVEHLGCRLIVVLGHERCGALKAALGAKDAPGHVGALVRDLQGAVTMGRVMPGDPLVNAIKANAVQIATQIQKEGQFGGAAGEIQVISGYYDLDTGVVEWPGGEPEDEPAAAAGQGH
ncbi:MAG: carbonic anhydrase [Candidatus Delongbacteria bacterium]